MRYIDSYAVFESKAVTLKYIKKSLEDNFCAFMYRKKNGDKRYAFGTLRYDFIKKRWSPSPNGAKKKSPFTLVYWDLARKNFRQFRIGSFIKMVDKDPDLETFAERHKEIYHKVRRYFPKKKKELVEPIETDTAENAGETVSEKLDIKPVDLKDFKGVYDNFNPFKDLKTGDIVQLNCRVSGDTLYVFINRDNAENEVSFELLNELPIHIQYPSIPGINDGYLISAVYASHTSYFHILSSFKKYTDGMYRYYDTHISKIWRPAAVKLPLTCDYIKHMSEYIDNAVCVYRQPE